MTVLQLLCKARCVSGKKEKIQPGHRRPGCRRRKDENCI